jgi:predicted PhzF superfamily epimerase YddE/YHI9
MTQTGSAIQAVENQRAALAKALGLSLKILIRRNQRVSTRRFNVMVPLRNRTAQEKIQMNMSELRV